MLRRPGFWAALAIGLFALALLAEWAIARRLEVRFREWLARGETYGGTLERVTVCLPCLSYTIHGADLHSNGGDEPAPVLAAPEIVIGFDASRLLRAQLRGQIRLHDATLHVDLWREDRGEPNALKVRWDHIGRGLIPAPVGRIEAVGGTVFLHYDRYEEPIRWRFDVDEGLADQLAAADGDSPHVVLRGDAPGGGAFALRLRVRPEGSPRSTLDGELRAIPLAELDTYIRQRLGLDVDGGTLTARIDLASTGRSWGGHLDCELVDLDLFELEDLIEQGPLQAAKDGFAELVSRTRKSPDGVLRMRIPVDQRVRGTPEDEWGTVAEILEWLLLAPFEAPFELIATPKAG